MIVLFFITILWAPALRTAVPVCPNVTPAKRHYSLIVSNKDVPLPGGKILPGTLVFNNSYIGPAIYATLDEVLSIDVFNNASVGGWLRSKLICSSYSSVTVVHLMVMHAYYRY